MNGPDFAPPGPAPTGGRHYAGMGARPVTVDGLAGTRFRVWAPHARAVAVALAPGNERAALYAGADGLWEGFVPGVGHGVSYAFRIESARGEVLAKADPYASACELPPGIGSRVWDLAYRWWDAEWMRARAGRRAADAPLSIYEVHLGSWRAAEAGERFAGYRRSADELAPYLMRLGFTHVELMPLVEHGDYGDWGYRSGSRFAPSARYGTPQDLMYLVDRLHQAGLGVILDWVPASFPAESHGLVRFDGTPLYEGGRARAEGDEIAFDLTDDAVAAFLIDSALYWLDTYHIDGLRLSGVDRLLRGQPGADDFLRWLTRCIHAEHPGVMVIAEADEADEALRTALTRPEAVGGYGCDLAWNLAWVHDALDYFVRDPGQRHYHQGKLMDAAAGAAAARSVLPLAHAEVVYGRRALLEKQRGDSWQKRASLRALFGLMWAFPGRKLLFMGGELGVACEWDPRGCLDWSLENTPANAAIQRWVADLNHHYRAHPALHAGDAAPGGLEWVAANDASDSVLAFLRRPAREEEPTLLVACNLTLLPRFDHALGVSRGGWWTELLNSDAGAYGGSGLGNQGGLAAQEVDWHGQRHALALTLPPLSVVFLESPR
ncbi:glycogen branching protein [Azoarcus olearius]|uniref:1,4-alpha-glucan branching enzyme n=1 Tax=Azoarcus sp. (strain BH72) TaxID=418699 RepID=UPI0008062207|nr:1,4-alpha-glucan branching enzyme [Azoarcus olearius]ANQ84983.1 glycogen branching protein [Azoarcus olearius]